ncbi:MAG: 3-dehydroquinate synthase [Bryobacterales bacterium]|nr:3-dehydroquinate synthase [Bryobacterales bacterium]
MASFLVRTATREYSCIVGRGALRSLAAYLPPKIGKIFVITTEDVWGLYSERFTEAMGSRRFDTLIFPGGEERKRMVEVEALAERMVEKGADRSSLVIAFGGGIVGDLGGFLAAIFMRGIPVIQAPTTLLAQVDASIGGKTGANLVSGKNLIGAFHQPLAVLIDPDLVRTLPAREYRAGLYEVIKSGIIASPDLFETMALEYSAVLSMQPDIVETIIAESVRIKAEVVSADERESDLRRILNFGHTIGHALEAETGYSRLLHGEAVAFGMRAVSHLGRFLGITSEQTHNSILQCIDAYGPIPGLEDILAENLLNRLVSDKKTIQGKVHFVFASSIGRTAIRSGVDPILIRQAIDTALSELVPVQ